MQKLTFNWVRNDWSPWATGHCILPELQVFSFHQVGPDGRHNDWQQLAAEEQRITTEEPRRLVGWDQARVASTIIQVFEKENRKLLEKNVLRYVV